MCSDEQYQCENGNFKLFTTRAYRTARMKLGDNYIVYKLSDLQYLLRIFYVIQNQQIHYLEAMPEVMDYAVSALTATDYFEVPVNANKYIVCPQLFEEPNAIL
jgi:cellulose synthase/poly-beta-1,6-N-acetylglucosamine synthase-like glycosyltransferase